MRIITGTARGTLLETPDGEDTRPTLGRVKENFFNAINFEVAGAKVLDLFAGSGQLGLEALSRGAREAVFVDFRADCVEIIRKNAQKAKLYDKCNILKCDYSEYLSGLRKRGDFNKTGKFDIAFLDPPYDPDQKLTSDCVYRLAKFGFMADNGLIICETGNSEKLNIKQNGIKIQKIYKYGRVYITIIKILSAGEEAGI